MFVVSQESFPGYLLFNIFLCDLFFIMNKTDLAIYADDNVPHRTANTINEVIQSLGRTFQFLWEEILFSVSQEFFLGPL